MDARRFVVLEDDWTAAEDIRYILSDIGYECIIYNNASEFFKNADSLRSLDIFIIDIMLKKEGLPTELDIEGAQTGEIIILYLRERFADANIFVVTAWNFGREDRFGTLKNTDRIFHKPCNYHDVLKSIIDGVV